MSGTVEEGTFAVGDIPSNKKKIRRFVKDQYSFSSFIHVHSIKCYPYKITENIGNPKILYKNILKAIMDHGGTIAAKKEIQYMYIYIYLSLSLSIYIYICIYRYGYR